MVLDEVGSASMMHDVTWIFNLLMDGMGRGVNVRVLEKGGGLQYVAAEGHGR